MKTVEQLLKEASDPRKQNMIKFIEKFDPEELEQEKYKNTEFDESSNSQQVNKSSTSIPDKR